MGIENSLSIRDKEIEKLKKQLAEKDAEIKRLEGDIKEKGMVIERMEGILLTTRKRKRPCSNCRKMEKTLKFYEALKEVKDEI